MRSRILALALTVAAGTAACGKRPEDAFNPVSPEGPTCDIVVALAGSNLSAPPCTTTDSYVTATGASTVTISGSGSRSLASPGRRIRRGGTITFVRMGGIAFQTSAVTVAVSITQSGQPHTGSFTSATAAITGSIRVTNGSAAYLTTTNTGANQGTFTLTFTKVAPLTGTASGTAYLVDGSLDATVPALASSGATGAVTLHITFKNN